MRSVRPRASTSTPSAAPADGSSVPGLPWSWGATPAEVAAPYGCGGLVPEPYRALWRAVDVAAPAARTYLWLRQLKVAPYSYDWIDNFGRRSPRRLTPELDEIAVGDTFLIFRVVAVGPGSEFTVVTLPAAERLFGPVAVTYRVTSVDDSHSRLVVRLDTSSGGLIGRLRRVPLAWGDLIMMRKQLLTLKHLAEAQRPAG